MTVENNAFFHLTYNIGGNLWMKDGSGMHAPWFGAYRNAIRSIAGSDPGADPKGWSRWLEQRQQAGGRPT